LKYLIVLSALLSAISFNVWAKSPKNKTTTYSRCSRTLVTENIGVLKKEQSTQDIIIAMETLSESKCKALGPNKALQYRRAGWKCKGLHNEEDYSCEPQKALYFAVYKGVKLDHLTFTNLQQHPSMLAYVNKHSNQLCHEDQAEITSSGVTDAICHLRK
jgi:hypothetical protein